MTDCKHCQELKDIKRALKHVHRILQRKEYNRYCDVRPLERRMNELEAIAFEYPADLMTDEEAF